MSSLAEPNRTWVGVTDSDWVSYLRTIPDLDEVNFWMPRGSRTFRALAVGEPFLFKLHSPQDYIVGGGFFRHFTALPVSLAWEAFGPKNGAPDYPTMRRRIARYRKVQDSTNEDYTIGCILLTSPFFFPQESWIPIPPSWAKNIVQGKTYPVAGAEGAALWEAVKERIDVSRAWESVEVAEESPMYGEPILMRPRLGQGTFRVLITDNFDRRCAATGEKALPVLEAAHIRPVADGGQHRIDNGLLLRSDLHRLYDRGYLTVDADYCMHVSSRLRSDFGNGEIYYPLEGHQIHLPRMEEQRPDRGLLSWHADRVFRT